VTDPLACWQHPAAHLQHNTSQHSTAQDSIVGYNNELLQAPSRTTYHGTAQFAQGTTKNCVPDPSACWQHSDVHLQHSTAWHSGLGYNNKQTARQTPLRVGGIQWHTCSTTQHSAHHSTTQRAPSSKTSCAAKPSACWRHQVAHLQEHTSQYSTTQHSITQRRWLFGTKHCWVHSAGPQRHAPTLSILPETIYTTWCS
jgi:hypothetical protein